MGVLNTSRHEKQEKRKIFHPNDSKNNPNTGKIKTSFLNRYYQFLIKIDSDVRALLNYDSIHFSSTISRWQKPTAQNQKENPIESALRY